MRIGFLLGAGVSIPAGMLSTQQLTCAVLSTEDYTLCGDGTFVRAEPHILAPTSWEQNKPILGSLLRTLHDHCQRYFDDQEKGRKVNYEDLFFAASQLHEHLFAEYENPAIEAFSQGVLRTLPQGHGRTELAELTGMVCDYIRDVVALQLSSNPRPLGHLDCLVDAGRDRDFEGCDIFTLNHDLLIEKTFDGAQLSYVDGFGSPDRDVAWWEPVLFDTPSRHYLLKLHGSINWVSYDGRLAKALIFDRQHARDANDRLLAVPDRAEILVGTFNKIRDYFETPYFELWTMLRRQLAKIDSLIVSGYGFGDKGVNTALCEWIRANPQSKLLVLHDDGDKCFSSCRGAIRRLWKKFGGIRLIAHSSYLSKCEWRNLRQLLETPALNRE
jgi:hypothetical protein